MIDFDETINQWRIRDGFMGSDNNLKGAGAFKIPLTHENVKFAMVVVDAGNETGWEHVSVHIQTLNRNGKWIIRTPSWNEMCKIKDLFWDQEECVMQYHPGKSEYVNVHPHVLHLWKPKGEFPTPKQWLI